MADPRDYISGRDLSDINNVDAVINSFFVYCHSAGPTLCPFYTGTTIRDISNRFENLFATLVSQSSKNASVITESLAVMKANLRGMVYYPISFFRPMAQQLVAYESVLRNLTYEGVEAVSSIGFEPSYTPGTIEARDEWQVGVICGEIPSIYNQTFADLSSFILALQKQSFLAGESWATIIVMCTGWPIHAAWSYTGEFPISRSPSKTI